MPWDDLITFWVNSGKRVNFSLSPATAQTTGLTSQYHSLGGSRGRSLLCLAPQLVIFKIIYTYYVIIISAK